MATMTGASSRRHSTPGAEYFREEVAIQRVHHVVERVMGRDSAGVSAIAKLDRVAVPPDDVPAKLECWLAVHKD